MSVDPTEQRRLLARALGLALAPGASAADVDDATLAALMDGQLDDQRRAEVAQALETSPRLRERWQLAMEARSALEGIRTAKPATRSGPFLGLFAMAAALAMVTVTLLWQRPTPVDPLIRDPIASQIVVAFGDAFLQLAKEQPPRAAPALWMHAAQSEHALSGGFAAGVAFMAYGLADSETSWKQVARAADRIAADSPCTGDACTSAAGLAAWALLVSLDCSSVAADLVAVRERLLQGLGDAVPAAWTTLPACELVPAVARSAGFALRPVSLRSPVLSGHCLTPVALPRNPPQPQPKPQRQPQIELYEYDLRSRKRLEPITPGQALALGTRLELCVDLPRAGHLTVWSFDRDQAQRVYPAKPELAPIALAAGRHCGRELRSLVRLCGVPGETMLLVHWSEKAEDGLPADAFGPLSEGSAAAVGGNSLRPPLGAVHRIDLPLMLHGVSGACVAAGGAA